MNLITDPWIPVADTNGNNRPVGLEELFIELEQIHDLAVKPHERVALMRFLICIIQATIKPADEGEWQDCKSLISSKVVNYLQLRKSDPFFELFGKGEQFNFLQVPNLEGKGKKKNKKASEEDEDEESANCSVSKLDMMLSSGNNATLFDNSAGTKRTFPVPRIALNLLTFQNFSTTGRIGEGLWNKADTPGKGSSKQAPCTTRIHSLIMGDKLLDTLHLNILSGDLVGNNYGRDKDENPIWGVPLWELPVNSLEDTAAKKNATMTYLGRLVPISRCIRLCCDENGTCESMILANCLTYPEYPEFRESSITLIQNNKKENIALSASLEKGLWRQLSSISIKQKEGTNSGPLALCNLMDNQSCKLWSGTLVADKAKILDTLESVYDLPANMFKDIGRRIYERGIALAETWSKKLGYAIKEYSVRLKSEQSPKEKARFFFWGHLEQHLSLLFCLVEDSEGGDKMDQSDWKKKIKETAFKAYEYACPQQTIREIEAFVLGKNKLYESKETEK